MSTGSLPGRPLATGLTIGLIHRVAPKASAPEQSSTQTLFYITHSSSSGCRHVVNYSLSLVLSQIQAWGGNTQRSSSLSGASFLCLTKRGESLFCQLVIAVTFSITSGLQGIGTTLQRGTSPSREETQEHTVTPKFFSPMTPEELRAGTAFSWMTEASILEFILTPDQQVGGSCFLFQSPVRRAELPADQLEHTAGCARFSLPPPSPGIFHSRQLEVNAITAIPEREPLAWQPVQPVSNPQLSSEWKRAQVSSKAPQTRVLLGNWLDLVSLPGHSSLQPWRPRWPPNSSGVPSATPIPMFDSALAAALPLCGPNRFVLP